ESTEVGFESLREKEMPDFTGVVVDHRAAERVASDFLERAADAERVARELHRAGIGEKLALTRYRRLDHTPEEIADIADDHQRDADGEEEGNATTLVLAAAAGAHSTVEHAAQQAAADEADDEDTADDGGDADIEPHVAVQDVAELVRDD